ncbi:hypothetical protein [Dyadobacter sp. CY343]|uniref:hypothetical protein n=1 Tax=Dyadobacter sp. CY343 TaxID=2907299 RepID=UPI001F249AA2|nr:hypothetical protein [Dyadobacter sp. CY343]MCE7063271.1 hypothetical protein [Dyadobacter sp. CY343]
MATAIKKSETGHTENHQVSKGSMTKEEIIEAFFKKKADEARIFLERNPIPEHLLSRNKKPRNP